MIKKKVILAMSGGVDSSVSAWLLKNKNYHVEGLFMKNWEEDDKDNYCNSAQDLYDVQNVCKNLNIYLHTINFSSEYWEKVFKVFLNEYKSGKTPNPDVLCNKEIKFKLFLNYSINYLKADYIATGHYARIKTINKECYLLKSMDLNKDQSYFLYNLKSIQLKKILFPVGFFKKSEIRNIAKEINLSIAEKKDSTGICFIGPRKIKNFLGSYLPSKKGEIITTDGEVIGKHDGVFFYTLGQRTGLRIGGIKNKYNIPWYVVEKNLQNNQLIVAQGSYNKYLMSLGLIVKDIHWINKNKFYSSFSCMVKIRHRHKEIPCTIIYISKKNIKVLFNSPIVAITPGQSAVFYLLETCIGGGVIDSRIPLINFF